MSAETTKQVLRQVLTAFDQGDWTIFDTRPGLYETRQHLPQMRAALPDLHHTIEVELVEGELIACVATVRGTHRGPLMGIAPTGASSNNSEQPSNRRNPRIAHRSTSQWHG